MHAVSQGTSPKCPFITGHLTLFAKDPLAFLESCVRGHGDVVPLRFLNRPVLLVNTPEAIESVLVTQSRSFRKTLGYRTPFMRRLFGQGLLTSEGELWTRQRRLAQPAFHRDRIASYARVVVEFAERLRRQWRDGESRNVHADTMRLTTEVVTMSLFHSPVPPEIDRLTEASAVVMNQFTRQWNAWRILLAWLPNRGRRDFDEVMNRLDAFIYRLIAERRASGRDEGDLLSMLLAARDELGTGMNDRQLRDELTTLMVAGLDTTALALSWSLFLLAKNPEVDRKLELELETMLAGRLPRFEDLPKLRFTEMVVKEAMRLYPPAWIVGREATQSCNIGGQPVPAGTSVIMSQWLQHRDIRHFWEPFEFRPQRWESGHDLPKFAYFPFGGGPRICIGSSFAMLEAVLALATLAQAFRVSCRSDYNVQPFASITLQPQGGIVLKIETRKQTLANASSPRERVAAP
ncbi:MAG: cytochrome P450 [Verrucomicrobiota bacterium]